MNQNIKVSTAVFIILIFSGLLFGKFWAGGEAKSVMVFSYIHAHPNGHHYIKLNNKLYGFDDDGQYQGSIDLSAFNIQEENASDFAFFSNGDLLIRKQAKNKNFIENLQRYFRYTNPTNRFSQNEVDGVFRCVIETHQCRPFTDQPLNLQDAFTLEIDWQTDRVFIADSSRHQVYMYSKSGEELDILKGLRFPNQITVYKDSLYIADTNHHRLVAYNISGDSFGPLTEQLVTYHAVDNTHKKWPASFLINGDERWVINFDNGMRNGDLLVFDLQEKASEKIALPEGADPFTIYRMGHQILVSDFSHDEIYRFNLQGGMLGVFDPEVLKIDSQKLIEQRNFYQSLEMVFTTLFTTGLIGGLIFALYQQRQASKLMDETLEQDEELLENDFEEEVLYRMKASPRFSAIQISLLAFIALGYCVLFALHWWYAMDIIKFLLRTWIIHLLVLFSLLIFLTVRRYKIVLTESSIIVSPFFGENTVCANKDILYNEDRILFGRKVFNINKLYRIFSAADIENRLYPVIKQGQLVSSQEFQAALLHNPYRMVRGILALLIFCSLFVYIMFK